MTQTSRQLAFLALRLIKKGAFADVAVDKVLHQTELSAVDRRLLTELVYGCVRRQRTLDTLIDQLATKKDQPPDLRIILHLGLYQLRYLNQIPASAAVNTTVELAKQNGFSGLTGFVNGLLRQYLRASEASDPLKLPDDPIERLGVLHSFPDWIVQVWLDQFGLAETEKLCESMNQPPHIDLRVNTLRSSLSEVEAAMQSAGIPVERVPHLPQALRLPQGSGAIQNLPGFQEGWWIVQDSSAQLVGYLVDPQPGEVIADACAAPGGKTMHLAELMHDHGTVWACDRTPSRLKRLQQNVDRLGLKSIQICIGDSRDLPQLVGQCDRVLIDAPCSGLGTLNRHADARWRQNPETVQELSQLQREILNHTASWVKPKGSLVYATCTLHPVENESVIQNFLSQHSDWRIERPESDATIAPFLQPEGWAKVLPHQQVMDGFFMIRLKRV
ncbi:16S rRNA (cytosine(967)-C(5))-methyltransferase [Phormidesmis priestleyi ULC007]|uniref:16S rRNA (cytosine(967)-C(5))-methyltransferase n=1 Tax=Phormidesmis priestleyi ULC007 TaxID=1920490 RepID=A0A2T1DME2_9CYAN|nr:16S rRNA (cytosine(967)-C(5))-methyltransferase [Phormidesmis priestleyi]PSB21632.1 16S rRNA (cytosine(967)-C(5))-methyltransferase [Phormidesmis priestleyi ULC007]PZO54673.1 MAG: 16S rRNA (cytosine(967)-C(5))-methyltransferase [Phormidesmis priestleyi]